MKISLKWLKEYVDITLPAEELAHRLSMSGTEVGGIQRIGGDWAPDKIVVGQITRLQRHPNADRLQLATVHLGGGEELTVVCGAWNIAPGDKAPFARVGATLIDGHTGQPAELRAARIRGVVSEGMLCSEKELGVGEDHTGILILPEDAPVGVPLADYLGDTILDLDVTPNRPDCLSVLGVAREVAALTGQRVREPDLSYPEAERPAEEWATVEIIHPDLCGRYCASIIEGVRIGPSPRWMQERLLAAGMRPINNIVDITNYVMMEYGQPLHAFDHHQIRDRKVVVRRAYPGEHMTTLDEVERELDPDMLLICDGKGPIALAGVMGGLESEVAEDTTTILLESANFNHVSIRHTSTSLTLRSEASSRFDKGLSPELPIPALRRATQLMVQLAGGKAATGILDVYPGKRESKPIRLTLERVSRVLGAELSLGQVEGVLASLSFQCQETASDKPDTKDLLVTPPYWRVDVHIPDDLVEEVARITGYDAIPTTMLSSPIPQHQPEPALELKERVRDILASLGLQEVITYSITSLAMLQKVAPHPSVTTVTPIKIANPMSREQEYLRTTLRPNLLATLAANERHQEGGIALFEVGRVYFPRGEDLPQEQEMAVGVIARSKEGRSWAVSEAPADFYDLKGIIEALFDRLGIPVSFEKAQDENLHPGRTAQITVQGAKVGIIGELHPEVTDRFEIRSKPVYLFEIDLEKLLPFTTGARRYQLVSRFPTVAQDLAVVVDIPIEAERVRQTIAQNPLVTQAILFDVYTGLQVPLGKKSLAYSITLQSSTHTLTGEEVSQARQEIIQRLEAELGATLRE